MTAFMSTTFSKHHHQLPPVISSKFLTANKPFCSMAFFIKTMTLNNKKREFQRFKIIFAFLHPPTDELAATASFTSKDVREKENLARYNFYEYCKCTLRHSRALFTTVECEAFAFFMYFLLFLVLAKVQLGTVKPVH
jgi:hypothetical protein